MSDFRDLLEIALARPGPTPRFAVGQRVRVKRTLACNTLGVEDVLGAVGVVESVSVSPLLKRVGYQLRFGPDRVEPFDEDELDWRYARRG